MKRPEKIPIAELLGMHTREGELFRNIGAGRIECFACGHRCRIGVGKEGVCRIRFNRGGKLFVPWGYVSSIALDPIEKKPFFHALPGDLTMSFGMLGCDYHCAFCQNWITSQTLRDPGSVTSIRTVTPEDIVLLACERRAKVVTSTYNEPLITSEWGAEIFKLARRYKLVTSYVSNGNGTPEVVNYLRPWLDLLKIDLKGFDDKKYRKLGGVLKNVLDTIKLAHDSKLWIEIVTLIVPGFNDSDTELTDIARFIASVSPFIPWHVTAFHSAYKMRDIAGTPFKTILRAVEIGRSAGLNYVYAGNIHGDSHGYENTYCHSCRELLIERSGFKVLGNKLIDGRCFRCNSSIPGFWFFPDK